MVDSDDWLTTKNASGTPTRQALQPTTHTLVPATTACEADQEARSLPVDLALLNVKDGLFHLIVTSPKS